MNTPPIDLSALDAFSLLDGTNGQGKPLILDIALIHEDPDQPRKAFDDIAPLAASVATHGVKVPISVRPHPGLAGNYIIKFGARRRRAAIQAGLLVIPAWIDSVPSDFEQVVENLQRKDLTPMELAQFIDGKLSSGMKTTEIAQKLAMPSSSVTKHLALIGAPAEIEAIYHQGLSHSPETIYVLRSLYKRFPEAVRAWLATGAEITRKAVEGLRKGLEDDIRRTASPVRDGRNGVIKADRLNPDLIKRPVICVKVDNRSGTLVLNRRAERDDQVLVRWDNDATMTQVLARDVLIQRLDDVSRVAPIVLSTSQTSAGLDDSP